MCIRDRSKTFQIAIKELAKYGLIIAPEKIQQTSPFNSLGTKIEERKFFPQKVQLRMDHLKTLNDFQKLLGDINWLRPSLGIPTYMLQNLFLTLQGDPDLNSRSTLSTEAKEELAIIEQQMQNAYLDRIDLYLPTSLIIFPSSHSPTGIIWQDKKILERLFLPHKDTKRLSTYLLKIANLIIKGCLRLRQLIAQDPREIVVALTQDEIRQSYELSDNWQIALSDFIGRIHNSYPKDKRITFLKRT